MKNLKQKILKNANRIVIKIGTHVLTNKQGSLDARRIAHLVEQIDVLSSNYRKQIILVSSGAVGAAMGKLAILKRPTVPPHPYMRS